VACNGHRLNNTVKNANPPRDQPGRPFRTALLAASTSWIDPPRGRQLRTRSMLLADMLDAAQRLVSSSTPRIVVGRENIARSLAGDEATLGVAAEDCDELCAIVGLGAQGLVRDDDRRPRQCVRRAAVEHFPRDRDAVKRAAGVITVVDRYRTPAQARAFSRHRCEYMRADRLAWIADSNRNLDARIEHFATMTLCAGILLVHRLLIDGRPRLHRAWRRHRRPQSPAGAVGQQRTHFWLF